MDDYTYLHKYARIGDTWKPSTSRETIRHARKTLDAVRNRQETSIPMLQSVLSLSAYPEGLGLLNNQSLIQDCILYIYRKQQEDPRYPFGCEHGYLCFRILVLSIGVSMLSRNESIHNRVVNTMNEESEREDPTAIVMQFVASLVAEQMNAPYCSPDDFLGWSSHNSTAIMTKANALILLDILWKDRKRFLRAWAETQAPSLNGLLFVLWRCVRIASTPDRWVSLCELYWRYCLVAEENDLLTLFKLNSDTLARKRLWLTKPTAVDLEDARNMLSILTARLSPTSPIYSPPNTPSLTNMVLLAVPNSGLTPGVEHLFIPFLRALFNHFWVFMAGAQEDPEFELHPAEVSNVIAPACLMLEHLILHMPGRAKDFVQLTAELGIIDALARAFTLVKKEIDMDAEYHVAPLVRPCSTFIDFLKHVGTSTYRETTFADSFVEWFKTLQYMRARDSIFGTRTHHTAWYTMADQCWIEVGNALGYSVQVKQAETLTRGCAYTRCPDPNSVKGVRFECPCDKGIVYCGIRCQQADWTMNRLLTSHRHTCSQGQ